MSGLGIFQSPCQIFTSFQAPKMGCAAKPSLHMQFRNRRFLPLKCRKGSNERADMSMNGVKRELLIEEIPYVDEVVKLLSQNADAFRMMESDLAYLEEAYERCTMLVSEHEKLLFSVFGQLPKEERQAMWAIYGGLMILLTTLKTTRYALQTLIDQWEERTKDILNGRPHDILDAALVDTISKFHIDRKPFEDAIEGLRMDITKKRYANFEELFLYCYHVAGAIGLILFQLAGIAPESTCTVSTKTIYGGTVYAFIALQLTDILKDVSEDATLGRIYLPQDELAQFGICDEDIFSRKVTSGWREFMKMQIKRVRFYYNLGEQGVSQCNKASQLLSVLMVYGQILDEIEERDYDNLTNIIGSQF